MVMTAAFGIVLLAVTALVTDIGYLYLEQARLQTAIDAGWKAGFDRMMQIKSGGKHILNETEKGLIRQHVRDVIKSNGYSDEDVAVVDIDFPSNNQLLVKSNKKVGLFFAQVIDIKSSDVGASRSDVGDLGTIIPLGIPHGPTKDVSPTKYRCELFDSDEEFTVGKEYIIKLGEKPMDPFGGGLAPWGVVPIVATDTIEFGFASNTIYILKQSDGKETITPGNFGCLDIDGDHAGGANDYLDRIKYGNKFGIASYNEPLSIGDMIYSETGNMVGATVEGVQYRFDNNLLDMRIPVVRNFVNGQSDKIEIIGFLNFRLTQAPVEDKKDKTATVYAMYLGADYAVDNTVGMPKLSFGRIDPDNISTNASQYLDFFKYGYSAAVEYGQMILPENGNASAPTAAAVSYRLQDNPETPKNVIVPITDIPGNVKTNNPAYATATTIYDLVATDNPNGVIGLASYTYRSSVRVTGFAEFELLDEGDYVRDGTNYDTGDKGDLGPVMPGQVRGKFIRYIVKPGTVN
jgi:hypothetical protein